MTTDLDALLKIANEAAECIGVQMPNGVRSKRQMAFARAFNPTVAQALVMGMQVLAGLVESCTARSPIDGRDIGKRMPNPEAVEAGREALSALTLALKETAR